MSSIFRKDDKFYDTPNRNNYDLSFQNNLTMNAGQIVTVLCKEVMPGDSLQFDPTFGIRAMPLVWPIQTRMKAYLHFYYVRNRNLWKDWPDFIGGTKQNLIPPYMYLTNNNRDMVNTGEIGDYFGIPTVTYGSFGSERSYNGTFVAGEGSNDGNVTNRSYAVFKSVPVVGTPYMECIDLYDFTTPIPTSLKRVSNLVEFNPPIDVTSNIRVQFSNLENINYNVGFEVYAIDGTFNISAVYSERLDSLNGFYLNSLPLNTVGLAISIATDAQLITDITSVITVSTTVSPNVAIENSELLLSDLPFISDDNPNGLRISTLPFRAYESIYNCFYRNAENNPLIGPDGQPEYNKWILNNDGGADTTHYKLRNRNWEDDFLTTALPSPQQGNAPLVGLTGTATINFASEDGTETVSATTDENGQIIAINAGNSNLSEALGQMVDYGISINDFRNVNALQRWLENNIRRGFKYQDQIQTHYGVSVRYDELDMPEFIGGASQSFAVNQISQTVSSDTQVLGDYAGQASCVGGGNQITHYCDEHGFIIGVLCISPVPNYSQLLPKHFLKSDKFDYFFPEFGHIGMQPITLKEITPLQTFRQQKADGSVNLEDTFGYQRAWYEYLASTDEVHGLFRNQLRNFVMNRTFDDTPELGPEFTIIDPNQLNDVFAVQDTSHKFLGQVYFDIKAKRPIPLYGIPKLE